VLTEYVLRQILLAPRRYEEERERVPALQRNAHSQPPLCVGWPGRASPRARPGLRPQRDGSSLPCCFRVAAALESVPLCLHGSARKLAEPSAPHPIRSRPSPHPFVAGPEEAVGLLR
jgi:hypothetical protein